MAVNPLDDECLMVTSVAAQKAVRCILWLFATFAIPPRPQCLNESVVAILFKQLISTRWKLTFPSITFQLEGRSSKLRFRSRPAPLKVLLRRRLNHLARTKGPQKGERLPARRNLSAMTCLCHNSTGLATRMAHW